jgi:hypothetical protein
MAQRGRFNPNRLVMPDSPYALGVTDFGKPFIPKRSGAGAPGTPDGFKNRIITNTTPAQLVGGVSLRLLARNTARKGIMIQNIDAAAVVRYSFGNDMGANGLQIAAGAAHLYDFVCPPDELYVFSTANAFMIVVEMSQGASE